MPGIMQGTREEKRGTEEYKAEYQCYLLAGSTRGKTISQAIASRFLAFVFNELRMVNRRSRFLYFSLPS